MDASKFKEYIATIWVLQLQGYINAACMTLWLYDYIGTFQQEFTLIWRTKWNIPKVLFILARYLPVVAFTILLYYNNAHLSAEACQTCQKLVIWNLNIAVCIAETIFTLRTWAVWNRSRKMGLILAVFSVAIWASHFILMALLLPTVQPIIIESSRHMFILGCDFLTTGLMVSRNYILITVFYSITLPFMIVRAYQCLSSGATELLKLVFFDGMVYYMALFLASWIILIVDLAKSSAYASTLSRVQHILCTVLACRMLLHLRQEAKRSIKMGGLLPSSTSGFEIGSDPLLFQHWKYNSNSRASKQAEVTVAFFETGNGLEDEGKRVDIGGGQQTGHPPPLKGFQA